MQLIIGTALGFIVALLVFREEIFGRLRNKRVATKHREAYAHHFANQTRLHEAMNAARRVAQ